MMGSAHRFLIFLVCVGQIIQRSIFYEEAGKVLLLNINLFRQLN